MNTMEAQLLSLIQTIGLPVIVLLFYLDGMVLGKVTPPSALIVTYIAVIDPPLSRLIVLASACVIASTLGQWTLYRGFNDERPEFFGIRRTVPYLRNIPFIIRKKIGDNRMELVTTIFERYGGIGICVTNAIPGIRSLMTIPAGLSRYPVKRFLLFSTIGNVAYLVLLVLVGWGILELVHSIAGRFGA